jgi:hypothetical protein
MTDTNNTPDAADNLMSPSEVIASLHEMFPSRRALSSVAPTESVRVSVAFNGSDGNTDLSPTSGALLSQDEIIEAGRQESQYRESRACQNEIDKAAQEIERIDAMLAEGHFDTRTGERVHAVSGAERQKLANTRALHAQNAQVAFVAKHGAEQREAAAREAASSRDAEDAVIFEAANGDPAAEKIIREEIKRIGARQLAEYIVASRQQPRRA